jgi:hypothetical protein
MDPNACVDRIVTAFRDADAMKVIEAISDLESWLGRCGFPPTNVEKLAEIQSDDKIIKKIIHRLRLTIAFPFDRGTAVVHDIVNPEAAYLDERLYCVRLDDRGDLCAYVWGMDLCSAAEEAEEYAAKQGWEINEDDVSAFTVNADDRAIVLFRSKMLTE